MISTFAGSAARAGLERTNSAAAAATAAVNRWRSMGWLLRSIAARSCAAGGGLSTAGARIHSVYSPRSIDRRCGGGQFAAAGGQALDLRHGAGDDGAVGGHVLLEPLVQRLGARAAAVLQLVDVVRRIGHALEALHARIELRFEHIGVRLVRGPELLRFARRGLALGDQRV